MSDELLTAEEAVTELSTKPDDHLCEACRQKGLFVPATTRVTIAHNSALSDGTFSAFDLCEDHHYTLMKFLERL